MKHNKYRIRIILFSSLVINCLHAQNTMLVKSNLGNETQFLISSIRSINFPSGNLQINEISGTNSVYNVSDVSKIYFGTVSTNLSTVENSKPNYSLYPCPVVDQLHVQYYSTSNNQVVISILDMSGRIVLQKKQMSITGLNNTIVNVSSLLDGFYICYTNTGDNIEKSKFSKSK